MIALMTRRLAQANDLSDAHSDKLRDANAVRSPADATEIEHIRDVVFFLVSARSGAGRVRLGVAGPRPGHGHDEDLMCFGGAGGCWVGAVFVEDACRLPARRCRVSTLNG